MGSGTMVPCTSRLRHYGANVKGAPMSGWPKNSRNGAPSVRAGSGNRILTRREAASRFREAYLKSNDRCIADCQFDLTPHRNAAIRALALPKAVADSGAFGIFTITRDAFTSFTAEAAERDSMRIFRHKVSAELRTRPGYHAGRSVSGGGRIAELELFGASLPRVPSGAALVMDAVERTAQILFASPHVVLLDASPARLAFRSAADRADDRVTDAALLAIQGLQPPPPRASRRRAAETRRLPCRRPRRW